MNTFRKYMLLPPTHKHSPYRKCAEAALIIAAAALIVLDVTWVYGVYQDRQEARMAYQQARSVVESGAVTVAKVLADKETMKIFCSK
jgi:hypothetical protein